MNIKSKNNLVGIYDYHSKVKSVFEKKEKEMLQCDHLLLKTREAVEYYGFHSSDCGCEPSVVCCVKCGFTSKYITCDMHSLKEYQILYPEYYYKIKVNNDVFRKQFGHGWYRSGKSFDDSVFDKYLMSNNGIIPTRHPVTLYRIAKRVNKDGTNDEIFSTMSNIYEIMTEEEKNKSAFDEQELEALLNRYENSKEKSLKMVNNH